MPEPKSTAPTTTAPKTTAEEITDERQADWDKQDEEVRLITETVEPEHPRPRAGITESGSGADGQGV